MQISVSHFGEHKRLHLESSKQNYHIISLRAIIKAIFTHMCDKPELTRWCLCSLHAGIQMSPDEVVGTRDSSRHSIAESTVDAPMRLFWQIFSARTSLFSCPFA